MTTLIYKAAQNGQAMTELNIVAAFVLLPIFLLVPIMGKFIDIKHTTVQSARYMAWERTAYYPSTEQMPDDAERRKLPQKSQTILERETLTRFFSATDDPILSTASTGPTLNNLWKDHTGNKLIDTENLTGAYSDSITEKENAIIRTIEDIRRVVQTPLRAFMDGATWVASQVNNLTALGGIEIFDQDALDDSVGDLPFLPDSEFPKENLYHYTVNFDMEEINARLQSGTDPEPVASMTASSALLTDTWSAQSPEMFQKRTEKRVPSKKIQPFIEPLQNLASTRIPGPEINFSTEIEIGDTSLAGVLVGGGYHQGVSPFAIAPELSSDSFIPGFVSTQIVKGNLDEPDCRFGECSYNQPNVPPGGLLGEVLDLVE